MKTVVCLTTAMAVGGLIFACSDEMEWPSAGGTGGSANGIGSGGRSGTTGGSPAQAGSAGQRQFNEGEVLTFIAGSGEVPYAIGENPYGVQGGAFLVRSEAGNVITIRNEPGTICIQGSLEEVPNGDYSHYWGVEIGFNLNQGPSNGAGGSAGAGNWAGSAGESAGQAGASGNAGASGTFAGSSGNANEPIAVVASAGAAGSSNLDEVARAWLPGTVIGFSFVIEGSTIDLIRFKALPFGYDATLESSVFCKPVTTVSGNKVQVLFSEMMQYCWDSNSNVALPTSSGLANISWQLPADVSVGARPFDWCLTELRPILAD